MLDMLLTFSFLIQVHKIQLITPNIGVAYRSTSGLGILGNCIHKEAVY
jgi:hypothetical protein